MDALRCRTFLRSFVATSYSFGPALIVLRISPSRCLPFPALPSISLPLSLSLSPFLFPIVTCVFGLASVAPNLCADVGRRYLDGQTDAKLRRRGLRLSIQDLQSPQHHTCLVCSSTRAHTHRESCILRRVRDGKYLGFPVAIKCFKTNEEDSDRSFRVPSINSTHYHHSAFTQRLCREIIYWKHLSHSNILPLLGVSVSAHPHSFRILSAFFPSECPTEM